jgi:cysteine desulfurase/selenocysteine lyase
MIREVSFDGTTFAEPPSRFEAGTPNFAAAAAMGTALEWVMGWDHEAVARHEADLRDYATLRLQEIPGLRLVGTAPEKVGILSFVLEGIHPHDIGTLLDRFGIAIRTGHHCAQPLMARMGIVATSRASLALYNERGDIDALVDALQRVREMF